MRASNIIPVFLSMAALIACHHRKEVQTGMPPEDIGLVTGDTMMDPQGGSVQITPIYTGTVRDMRNNEGCDFLIELDAGNGEKMYLEPLYLDERYKVDGLQIQFIYTDSRRPSKCTLPSKPIVIDKIIE